MQGTNKYNKTIYGFTIIEIIIVLVVIGILAAVAVSKTSSLSESQLSAEVETMKTHLRYAQARAMSDGIDVNNPSIDGSWTINFTANSYTLVKTGSAATPSLPNENSTTHTLQGGVLISGSVLVTPVTFDICGSPGASTITITLSAGSNSKSITITKNTGFIP